MAQSFVVTKIIFGGLFDIKENDLILESAQENTSTRWEVSHIEKMRSFVQMNSV